MIHVIPAVIPRTTEELAARADELSPFAPRLHLDINDGVFTAEASWPYREGQMRELVASVERGETLPRSDALHYEAHLMAQEPRELGLALLRAGVKTVIAHLEAFERPAAARDALEMWKKAGALEVGIAVLIDTPLSNLEIVHPASDIAQFMSIPVIGGHGAPFDDRVLARVQMMRDMHPAETISVDGGVNESNIVALAKAGASRFVVGSAILNAIDKKEAYARLLDAASALQ